MKGFARLSPDEVKKATKSGEKAWKKWSSNFGESGQWIEGSRKGYNYKNETLIEKLHITESEQQQLKTIISKGVKLERKNETRRKARRNENGLTARQQAKAEKAKIIKKLLEEGLKQKELAQILGITQQYISKVAKQYK